MVFMNCALILKAHQSGLLCLRAIILDRFGTQTFNRSLLVAASCFKLEVTHLVPLVQIIQVYPKWLSLVLHNFSPNALSSITMCLRGILLVAPADSHLATLLKTSRHLSNVFLQAGLLSKEHFDLLFWLFLPWLTVFVARCTRMVVILKYGL
jgi:hypothetical protein